MTNSSHLVPVGILSPPPGRDASGWDPYKVQVSSWPEKAQTTRSVATNGPHAAISAASRIRQCFSNPIVVGYVALTICVLVYSTLAPDLDLLSDVPPATRVLWRATSAAIAFACAIVVSDYLPRLWRRSPAASEPQTASGDDSDMTTRAAVAYACLASVFFSMWAGVYVVSLSFTSPGQATLFGDVQGMFLVALRLLSGKPVSVLEVVGCLVAVGGAALVSQDPAGSSSGASGPAPSMMGNMIALGSSLGGTLYIMLAQKVIKKLGTLRFMLIVQIGTALIAMVGGVSVGEFDARSFIEPLNTANGVLGWLAPEEDRLGAMLYCGFVVGLLGMGLFAYSLSAISGAVVGGSMLLTPALTMAVAVAMHMSAPPGLFTYLGTATLIGGLLMVIWGESLRDGLAAALKARAALLTKPVVPTPKSTLTAVKAGDCATAAATPTFMQRVCGVSINGCCIRGAPTLAKKRRLSGVSDLSAESQPYLRLADGPASDSVV